MFAGAPGAGKTTAALYMALKANVPTLYFSADSDEITMAARAACAVTGHPYGTVRESQINGLYDELYGERIAELPLRFVFDPSEPSLDDITNGITAWVELWGTPPSLVIVDNLMNMQNEDGGNEWQGMRSTVKGLHWLARRTKACVWLLHHTSEQSEAWITSAPPRSAIQGKLAQLPEVILTMANHEGVLWVAVAKNRHGKSDPLARAPLRMVVDFVTMRIWDEPMMQGGLHGSASSPSPGGPENVPRPGGSGGGDGWSPSRVIGGH
jgi:hypothetical protein